MRRQQLDSSNCGYLFSIVCWLFFHLFLFVSFFFLLFDIVMADIIYMRTEKFLFSSRKKKRRKLIN